MSNFKLAFFVLNIFFSSITSMDIRNSVLFDHKSDYSGLPNEIPILFGMGILRNNQAGKTEDLSGFRKYVYDNRDKIGTLPMAEQIAFLESLKTENSLDKGKFDSLIISRKIREKENESFRDFLEDYEKQMSYGLGAIQYTSNKYVYKSDYNQDMHKIIYSEIADMISAQKEEIQNKAKLFAKVQEFLLQNRENLYQNNLSVKDPDTQTMTDIVNTFLKYFENHEKFTRELHKHGLKAEIALSNMDGCRNFNSPERNAGVSSTYLPFPKISYKKGKKPIAINGDELIGIENKTSNGFEIFQGFFEGNSVRNSDENANVNSYVPRSYKAELEKVSNFPQKNANVEKFIEDFNKAIYQENITDLLKSGLIKESYFSGSRKKINFNKKCTQNYLIFCEKTEKCKELTTPKNFNYPTELNDATILAICEEKEYPNVMYLKKENDVVTEIDAISMNRTYSEILNKVYQGCFGVFTSGGKRDKDACRDVMNKKCGIDLDYHAKKLGLYDYINSNPSSSYDFSNKQVAKISEAYEWIKNHFFINQIALKPSALIGTSLILQKDGEEFYSCLEPGSTNDISYPSGYDIKVLSCNKDGCEDNDNHVFKVYMNKANHFILENSSGTLKFKFLNAIFIIGILFLF